MDELNQQIETLQRNLLAIEMKIIDSMDIQQWESIRSFIYTAIVLGMKNFALAQVEAMKKEAVADISKLN